MFDRTSMFLTAIAQKALYNPRATLPSAAPSSWRTPIHSTLLWRTVADSIYDRIKRDANEAEYLLNANLFQHVDEGMGYVL
jgi:hypothetical protein